MNAKQLQLQDLIAKIDSLHYIYTYDRIERPEEEYLQILAKANAKNDELLNQIYELLKDGVDLNFRTNNNRSVMDLAVVTNNVKLVEMLLEFGADLNGDGFYTPLHRAAESDADRVVKFLIEEKGLNPRRKTTRDYSVLAAASSSRYSKNVLPYLIEVLKQTKSERLSPPKKARDLAETNVLDYIPKLLLPAPLLQKIQQIMEAIFLEEHSVSLSYLYETVHEQEPELIFACIDLIGNTSTTPPQDKTLKKVANQAVIHHGNLEVSSHLSVNSLLVTGNLIVRGNMENRQGRQLYVGGDLVCENMYTEGPVIIGGNLTAKRVEAAYNDYALEVKQTLTAQILIIDHHQVKAGKLEVEETMTQ